MRHPSRFATAFLPLLVLAAAGCAQPDRADEPVGTASQAILGACGSTHWVGRSAPCTSITSWTATPLFGGTAPPALQDYCLYEWTGGVAPTGNDVFDLVTGGPTQLAEDCPVMVPQSPSADYDAALAGSLRASLHAQVSPEAGSAALPPLDTADAMVGLALVSPLKGVPVKGVPVKPLPVKPIDPLVRVVLVDSAPDALHGGSIPIGLDRHGDTLAHIVGDLAGPAADTATALALPWVDESTYSEAGGYGGRLSDVAKAVFRALDAWTEDGRTQRLILNLSIGWEDVPGVSDCNDSPETLRSPARAVYDALQVASCQGALVIAAAGNDPGGPTPPDGLICPARWEALPLACDEVAYDGAGLADPRPLGHPVFAVGGVDYADRPIVSTRAHGRPRLAATALGGVSWGAGEPVPAPLTGSSVAAAVMSAVSAATWANDPGLLPEDVVELVHAAGVPLGDADVCQVAGPCEARRISLCAAATGPCVPASALVEDTPPLLPDVFTFADALFPPEIGTVDLLDDVDPMELAHFVAPSGTLVGGASGQPGVPFCPSCVATLRTTYGSIYVAFGSTVTNPTLVLNTCTGTRAVTLATVSPSTPTTYSLPGTTGVTSAWLTGMVGTSSVTQQISIAR